MWMPRSCRLARSTVVCRVVQEDRQQVCDVAADEGQHGCVLLVLAKKHAKELAAQSPLAAGSQPHSKEVLIESYVCLCCCCCSVKARPSAAVLSRLTLHATYLGHAAARQEEGDLMQAQHHSQQHSQHSDCADSTPAGSAGTAVVSQLHAAQTQTVSVPNSCTHSRS